MNYFKDLFHRLRLSWRWVLAQFVGIALFIAVGLAWTRLPEKHVWQVVLSLLIPVLLAISILELQAGTMRKLADDDEMRVKLVWGAATLLVWAAMFCAAWAILDWCDDQIPEWASYLNSRASAHVRGALFTYNHIQRWLNLLEWILRWIVVPGKIVPYATASALRGWRLQWGRVLRILWSWRWWLAVVLAAMLAVWLPGHLFADLPHGTVHAQFWHVGLKLAATYLLGVGCWVLVLAWLAVLWSRLPEPAEDAIDQDLLRRLCASRNWIGAQFGWVALSVLTDVVIALLPIGVGSQIWVMTVAALVLLTAALILQTATIRSLLIEEAKRVRLVWGTLSVLIWTLVVAVVALLLDLYNCPTTLRAACWIVIPAVLVPFAAASALWGVHLPWRRIFRILRSWQWWVAVVVAVVLGRALPGLFATDSISGSAPSRLGIVGLQHLASGLFTAWCWILLLGWLAVLFGRQQKRPPAEEVLVPVPVLTGPEEKSGSAKADVPPDEMR